jgi:predicted 2-oxoglutarate/Fe(II)-dependent dioxygenase YbiX
VKYQNTTPLRLAELFFSGLASFGDETHDALPPTMPEYDTPPNSHSQIMILPNFITKEMCAALRKYADERTAVDLSVFDPDATNSSGEIQWEVDKSVRDTQMVEYDEELGQQFNQVIGKAVREIINPYYGIDIKSAEAVQFLKYGVGGKYDVHIDAESLWHVKTENRLEWRKSMDRDISILIYLNEEYEGGQLVFPNQHIALHPKAGMLVAFPSDHHFAHGVMPVTKGTRYALVTWASLSNLEGEQ